MNRTIRILLATIFAMHTTLAFGAGRIQNEDIKSLTDVTAAVLTTTGNLTISNACITSPGSTTGLAVGLFIYDTTVSTRISSGTTIAGLPGTCSAGQIQMSTTAIASGTGDTITFGGQMSQLINDSKIYVASNSINSQLSTAITNGLLGGAGGSKNYLGNGVIASNGAGTPNSGNGDFEKNSSAGWNLAHSTIASNIPTSVASAGTPFDSTHGGSAASGNLTKAIVSSGQLQKNYSVNYASSAASVAGDMLISDGFFIDTADQAKVMTIKFAYSLNSGSANTNFSGTSSNSFSIWIYDVTNAVWIQPQGVYNLVQNSGSSYASATFQTSSSGIRYQIALINNTASSGAFGLYADDFSVGPQSQSGQSPAMTDWVAYTPTFVGFGTVTNVSIFSRRNGDSLEVKGRFQAGTVTASTATMTLGYNGANSNITLDTVKIPSNEVVGLFSVNTASATSFAWSVVADSAASTSTVGFGIQTSAQAATGRTTGTTLMAANNLVGEVNFKVAIAGWSSNAVSSADTDTRIVAARIGFAGATSLATSGTDTIMPSGSSTVSFDTHSGWNSTNRQYTVPVSGKYRISGNIWYANNATGRRGTLIYKNSSDVCDGSQVNGQSGAETGTNVACIVDCVAGDLLEMRYRQDSGGALNTGGSSTSSNILNIERVSGAPVVQQNETVAAFYQGNPTFSPALAINTETTVTFPTKIQDTHGAYSSGTYTVPVSGTYAISYSDLFSGAFGTQGNITARVKVNGTTIYQNISTESGSSAGSQTAIGSLAAYPLKAGDAITFTITSGSYTTIASVSGATSHSFSISRVGN